MTATKMASKPQNDKDKVEEQNITQTLTTIK